MNYVLFIVTYISIRIATYDSPCTLWPDLLKMVLYMYSFKPHFQLLLNGYRIKLTVDVCVFCQKLTSLLLLASMSALWTLRRHNTVSMGISKFILLGILACYMLASNSYLNIGNIKPTYIYVTRFWKTDWIVTFKNVQETRLKKSWFWKNLFYCIKTQLYHH